MSKYIFPIVYVVNIVLLILYTYHKTSDVILIAIILWFTSIIGPIGVHFRTQYSLSECGRETKILTLLRILFKGGKQDLSKTELMNVYIIISWFILCSVWLIIVLFFF